MCPANLVAFSFDGNASPVTYEAPSVIAGEPPLKIACTPASGATFALGNTAVTCNVTDAALRVDACAFIVTLAVPPKISATSFMAFGNSITEGKTPSGAVLTDNYPENLRTLLAARYIAQSITMLTKAVGGELAVNGVDRLRHELDAVHPQVVLLEEGINDLNGDPASIPPMIDALRSMVRMARDQGVSVFLATLPPVRAGGTPPAW